MSDKAMSGDLEIVNDLGLHARAASKFVGLANKFQSEVYLGKDGSEINAKSILGVLMLTCAKGNTVSLRVEGPDAKDAFEALAGLVKDGFGEL